MADEKDLEGVNRELRARVQELERQLISRHTAASSSLVIGGEASLGDQLEAMLAFEPASIYMLGLSGLVVHVTGTANKSDRIGQIAFEQVHRDSRDEFKHRFDQLLALGEPIEFEIRAREDDAEAKWYRARLSPWWQDGSMIGAIAVLSAIDDERQARIEGKRFRAILDQANEGIFVVDPRSGKFVDVNTTACHLLRYTRSELLELGLKDIEVDFPLSTREQWANHMIEIMAVGTMVREGVERRKDGSTFPAEVTMSIKPFEGDEYLLVVARDMTEAKRIREELRHAEESLRVSDRLTTVGTMAAGVAHEINNPLAYVMGNIEFAVDQIDDIAALLPDPVRLEVLESLTEARHGATRMSRIVRDLRTFSRRDDDSSGPVAVNEVLDSSINIAMNEIRPRAQLQRAYMDDLLVLGNESRLGQVFLNLIINAAQAIPLGDSKHNLITVSTRKADDMVVVDVSDTGPGMSEDVASRIFEAFFTTKPIGVGTGLGLSICQNIVEGLGGTIKVNTRLGHGTTFSVCLLAAPDKPIPDRNVARIKRSGKAGRLLIIDDDPRAAKALRRILHTHEVTMEHDGRAGLELALEHSFDVIFCDMMMPDFGGIEFYEALEARRPELAQRVIFVTGGTFTHRAREFIENTDNDFISKPYDAHQVRRIVGSRVR